MTDKKYIAIIYEGEKTESQLLNNLNKNFFKDISELVPIMFPAGENIYMLWKQLKKDDFETDLIEVVREYNTEAEKVLQNYQRNDFMEIYLFFDYDGHQNNLGWLDGKASDILEEMLNTFCEETEFGKLYVNYPMVESLRDNKPPLQEYCFRNCAISLDEIGSYKHSVHTLQDYQDFRKLDHKKWGELMGQHNLYIRQKEKYITLGKIAVINSFPLFLLEYFKEDFWNEMLISYTDKPIRETIECKEIISTSICQKI